MDFALDEQERAVQDLATTIVADHAAPERLTALDTSGEWWDAQLWARLAEAGLLGIGVPEEAGGAGLGLVGVSLLAQAVAAAAAHVAPVDVLVGAADPLARLGTPGQRERWLPPLLAGETLLVGAPGPGLVVEVRAERTVLTGGLSHVLLADRAQRLVVEATDADGVPGLYLLDPASCGVRAQSSVDRRPRFRVDVDAVPVTEEDVLVAGDAGPVALVRDRLLAARCVEQAAGCRGGIELAARYVTERTQFGRPVGTFQAVAHQVADAYIDTEGVSLTAWRAVWLTERGDPCAEELAIAAWWAVDAAVRAMERAMHVHGGISVDMDYPAHRYYLAVKGAASLIGAPSERLAALGDLLASA